MISYHHITSEKRERERKKNIYSCEFTGKRKKNEKFFYLIIKIWYRKIFFLDLYFWRNEKKKQILIIRYNWKLKIYAYNIRWYLYIHCINDVIYSLAALLTKTCLVSVVLFLGRRGKQKLFFLHKLVCVAVFFSSNTQQYLIVKTPSFFHCCFV